MINAALVLEGGSLRSLYTAGVLDVFLEKNMEFSCVIGISAGALVAANYISKQKFRSAKINIIHSSDPNYYGVRQFLKTGNAFNFDYLFNSHINKIYPYNVNVLSASNQRFYIGATDCESAIIKYFEAGTDYSLMTKYLQASCSLPWLADMVRIDGHMYLDGGIIEPIPVKKAIEENYKKIVVVLTREEDYKKQPKKRLNKLFDFKYKQFPHLSNALNDMNENYNRQKRMLNELQSDKTVFIIQPDCPINLRRMEKDARKLVEVYFRGVENTEQILPELCKYLCLA